MGLLEPGEGAGLVVLAAPEHQAELAEQHGPVAPLALTMMSFEDLLKRLFGILF